MRMKGGKNMGANGKYAKRHREAQNFDVAVAWGLAGACLLLLDKVIEASQRGAPGTIAFYCIAIAIPFLIAAGGLVSVERLVNEPEQRPDGYCKLIVGMLMMSGTMLAFAGIAAFIWSGDRQVGQAFIAAGFVALIAWAFWMQRATGIKMFGQPEGNDEATAGESGTERPAETAPPTGRKR
jgi:hypothetical protein